MNSIFGIDLGTTYCSIARFDAAGRFELIANSRGEVLTPSAVFVPERGELLVGQAALEAGLEAPMQLIQSAKQRMGDAEWLWTMGKKWFRPQDIAALLLQQLKSDAERATQQEPREVVITVPAYFNDLQRTATTEAAQLVGLDPLRLLNEPTAAALAYAHGAELEHGELVLVIDLGGGTLDLSVLENRQEELHVKATFGRSNLGGENWDDLLLHRVGVRFVSEYGCDPLDDPFAFQELKQQCMEAKHRLSVHPDAELWVEYEGHGLHIRLSREEFERWSAPLLGQVEDLLELMLDDTGLQWSDFSSILLAGGASRMPMLHQRVERLSGIHPTQPVHPAPEHAVVYGAALQAASFAEEQGETGSPRFVGGQVARDVNTHSLGVVVLDGRGRAWVDPVIPRFQPLPHTYTHAYYTAHDHQVSVSLELVEGESPNPLECVGIGSVELSGLPPRPAGQKVEVSLTYDESGRLAIEITDVGSGQHQRVLFQRTASRSLREIERMKRLLMIQRDR